MQRDKEKEAEEYALQTERLLIRAGGRCEHCHKKPKDFRGLSRHHLVHKKMGGTRRIYKDEDIELWCGVCHDAEHGTEDK